MAREAKTLEELIREVPPENKGELRRYLEFLVGWANKPRGKPKFAWAGALKDMRDHYTSVELQHQIARWRIGGE